VIGLLLPLSQWLEAPANGENALINSIASAVENDHSSRPTWRSAAIGFWKMPKLWRAPMPMVRITAPEITPIQKLRDAAGGDETDTAIECLTLVTRRMLVTPP
jgi:hypothetical protein